jgi:hypothetical protein
MVVIDIVKLFYLRFAAERDSHVRSLASPLRT